MLIDLDPHKEPCIVEGCNEHIAPTMWLIHMTNHAKGVLPGAVPTSWLREQSRYICPNQWRPGYFMAGGAHMRTAPPPGALLMNSCPPSADSTSGGGGGGGGRGVLSAFSRFNEWGGGGVKIYND